METPHACDRSSPGEDMPGGPGSLASMDLETALTRRAWRLALVVPIVLVAGAVLLRSAWPLLVPRTPHPSSHRHPLPSRSPSPVMSPSGPSP